MYIAGCDGAHSTVRAATAIGSPGGTYERLFYVADVAAAGPVMNGELHVALDEADLLAVFPLKRAAHARFIGTVREAVSPARDALSWDDVSRTAMDHLGVSVERVHWFSTYRVHHRVANRFQQGRAFLLGDAAHIHSPVGGQGMNTGIGDAVNLAWKLAAVVHGRSPASILNTYEPERIAFARRLVATTDRAFTVVTSSGRLARFVRTSVVPRLLPVLFKSTAVRRLMFRTVSQIAINYHDSAISEGAAGRVKAGDRLPWVRFDEPVGGQPDNFAPLASLEWQAHVYGERPVEAAKLCASRGLPLHAFPWQRAVARAGLKRDALYLVRPDGYVALADSAGDASALARYLETHAIQSRPKDDRHAPN